MSDRLVVHGGHVLSMDPSVGEIDGDVLVEDGRIAAVGGDLSGADARVLDVSGQLVMPGMVDTHRHLWQTTVRGLCADWTLPDYLAGIRMGVAPAYTPDDIRLSTRLGALEAVNAGVTTLVDYSHALHTPEHADAAVAGLAESGVRGVFAYGFFDSAAERAGWPSFAHRDRLADFARVAAALPGLLVRAAAITEIGLVPFGDTVAEVRAARDAGAVVLAHTGCSWGSQGALGLYELHHHGLLDAHQIHVHANTLDAGEWRLLADSGAAVSISPSTETHMGMGVPVFARCEEYGVTPSLSCDVVSLCAGDLIGEARLGLAVRRLTAAMPANAAGAMPERVHPPTADALRWLTVDGARALHLDRLIGSIAVGKRADLVTIGGPGLGQHPRVHAANTVVMQSGPADVRTVVIDGRVVKAEGRLLDADLPALLDAADESAAAILARVRARGVDLSPPMGDFAGLEPFVRANIAQAYALPAAADGDRR